MTFGAGFTAFFFKNRFLMITSQIIEDRSTMMSLRKSGLLLRYDYLTRILVERNRRQSFRNRHFPFQ